MKTISKFLGLTSRRRRLLTEAAWQLFIARIQTSALPFRRLAPSLGAIAKDSADTLPPLQEAAASDISWAINRAARHLPLTLLCLQQAIAARHMLARRGIPGTLYLGTRRSSDNSLLAHAWLRSGSIKVAGGNGDTEHAIVSRFSWPKLNLR